MGILELIVVFALIGFCLYLVLTYVPMPEPMKQAMVVLVVILLVLYIGRMVVGGGPVLRLP